MKKPHRVSLRGDGIPLSAILSEADLRLQHSCKPPKRKHPLSWVLSFWRRHPDLNRGSRICSPMPYHLAMAPSSGDARCAALSAAGLRPLAKSSAALPPPSSQIQNSRFVFVQGCGASRYINFCSFRNRKIGAGDEARTRYLHLGKVALYRMSYARRWCLRSESNQRHADFQSAALPSELQRHICTEKWWEQLDSNQ